MENDVSRCAWVGTDEVYISYHDHEWGVSEHGDKKLFELLILEGMQAGLSWITILRKRENYRKALDGFDFNKIVLYDEKKIEELILNDGIIRNRLKINSIVQNAKAFINIRKEFSSFNKYIWNFVKGSPIRNNFTSLSEIPSKTDISDLMSKDLKKRGFNFVGSTICYAFMQASGMTNDHITSCFRYKECNNA